MKSPIHRHDLLMMLMIVILTTALQGGKPQILLRGGFAYPRIDLTTAESLYWRTTVSASQIVNNTISWQFLGDMKPATLIRGAGLNIYSARLNLNLKGWQASLGRQFFWNALQNVRYDGVSLSRIKGKMGNRSILKIYGGLVPDSPIRTDYGEAGGLRAGAMVQISKARTTYVAQVWATDVANELNMFAGGSVRVSPIKPLVIIADGGFNITAAALDKLRLRANFRLTKTVSLYVQYRQAGQFAVSPYPWHTEKLNPRTVFTAGATGTPTRNTYYSASYTERLGEATGSIISVNGAWKWITISFRSYDQSRYSGTTIHAGVQHKLGKSKAGFGVGRGSYRLSDPLLPPPTALPEIILPYYLTILSDEQSTLAINGWLEGPRTGRLTFRLFGQFTANRQFTRDGRAGLEVSVAL